MISAFSSRLNGTFFTPPMCQVEQRELPGCIIACLVTWTLFSYFGLPTGALFRLPNTQINVILHRDSGSRQGMIPFVDAIIFDNQLANWVLIPTANELRSTL